MTMYTAGELIRAWRDAVGMSQRELAQRAGTARQMISRYENDDASPSIEMFYRIALALGVDLATFVNGPAGVDGIEPPAVGMVNTARVGLPYFEHIPTGGWTKAMLETAETITVTTSADVSADHVIALRVTGTDMYPTLLDGDVLLVNVARQGIASGEVGIYATGGTPIIRRYVRRDRRKWLESDNQSLPPIDVTANESHHLIGVVVGLWRDKP